MALDRRVFLQAGLASAAAHAAAGKPHRLAIIGHTGRGDYGHEWDASCRRLESVKVVAVADPVDAGRAAAMKRSGAERGYRDYREMLAKEKPDLAGIFPRWSDQRLAMIRAAAEAGANILVEKPLARNLEEADQIVELAEKHGIKIQVGHTARTAPVIVRIKEMLAAGEIGSLLEIRARGKEDQRAGGEDLMVLGIHALDLMRYFAGDPAWIFGHVTQASRELNARDVREGGEQLGPVAGDDIAAMFSFRNVHGYFSSKASDRASSRFAVTLCGSRGAITIPLASYPSVQPRILRSPSWLPESPESGWKLIEMPAGRVQRTRDDTNVAMLADLIAAVDANRQPACSARDGRWALEMALSIFESQKSGARVSLPLKMRRHPLTA
jgi:predicted dehydrogenase